MLLNIYQLEKLQQEQGRDDHDSRLLRQLYSASLKSLQQISNSPELTTTYSAKQRYAFREFGLSIGLHAMEHLLKEGLVGPIVEFKPFLSLATDIERFWLNPSNQVAHTWIKYLDINEVMLATSLDPESWLWVSNDNK